MILKRAENEKFILEIHPDDMERDWKNEFDRLGTMVCFHNKYDLGDNHNYKKGDFTGWDDLKQTIEKDNDVSIILPLFLFDHSGLSISTNSDRFRAQDGYGWDWMQVGWIFVSKEDVKKEYSLSAITDEVLEKARSVLIEEVKTYDMLLKGEIYGYILKDKETQEEIDSCWGLWGSDFENNGMKDYLPEEARSLVGELQDDYPVLYYGE